MNARYNIITILQDSSHQGEPTVDKYPRIEILSIRAMDHTLVWQPSSIHGQLLCHITVMLWPAGVSIYFGRVIPIDYAVLMIIEA